MVEIDVIVFFIMLLCSAFFSGTETALTAVTKSRLASLAEKGDKRAALALKLISDRSTTIAGMLVGNNMVNTMLAVFTAHMFDSLLPPQSANPWLAPVLASLVSIIFLLVAGEVIPKNMALANQDRWALFAARPVIMFLRIISPALWILERLNRLVTMLFGRRDNKGQSLDELVSAVKIGREEGLIDRQEMDFIRRSMVINDKPAKQYMIHRINISAVSEDSGLDEIKAAFYRDRFSRLPVYRGTLDHIVGVLHFKEVHGYFEEKDFAVQDHLRPPVFFPENAPLGKVFEAMRQSRNHIAILVDEFGGTAGLISVEDIIEQVFGDIRDEYDDESGPEINWITSDSVDVLGSTRISEIQKQLAEKGLPSLPQEEVSAAETAAGIAQKALGAAPEVNSEFEAGPYRFKVKKVNVREIKRLNITRIIRT